MKKLIPKNSLLIPDGAVKAYEGRIYQHYEWQQELFDGSSQTFEMLKRKDTVSVIGIVNDKILVIDDNQSFKGHRKSFPGGSVDEADASWLAAAKRELAEETGYGFDSWRLIKVTQPFDEIEWFACLFLAWGNPREFGQNTDAGEQITVASLSFDAVKDLVLTDSYHLGVHADIFSKAESIHDLLDFPTFDGQEVDR
ncbi:MAG TPA: NUDIX domain-containing protein [Candidatus Saccharimonadales bacterium]|nr:NUDIX domain-containing protein [Candidatus Saccharimonadales bacterium]